MKKMVLLTVLAFLLFSGDQLYGADFGIRGGLNFSSYHLQQDVWLGNHFKTSYFVVTLPESYVGFHFGVFTTFSIGNVFVQPELLYTETGQQMAVKRHSTNEMLPRYDYFTPVYSHLKMPLNVGMRFGPLRFGAGPVFSLLLNNTRGHYRINDVWDEARFNYRDSTVGYQLMVGLKLGNLKVDFKYEDNLSQFGDGIGVGGEHFEFDMRPRQYMVSLGIVLF